MNGRAYGGLSHACRLAAVTADHPSRQARLSGEHGLTAARLEDPSIAPHASRALIAPNAASSFVCLPKTDAYSVLA